MLFHRSKGPYRSCVLDHSRNFPDLMIKRAIHIQTTPLNKLISRDKGAKTLGYWVATINVLALKQLRTIEL